MIELKWNVEKTKYEESIASLDSQLQTAKVTEERSFELVEWLLGLSKEAALYKEELEASRNETTQLEVELNDARADLLKLQGEDATLSTELKRVLLCLQQYYVENEVLKKGVLQLGGDDVLSKLLSSSKDVSEQLYATKPKESPL